MVYGYYVCTEEIRDGLRGLTTRLILDCMPIYLYTGAEEQGKKTTTSSPQQMKEREVVSDPANATPILGYGAWHASNSRDLGFGFPLFSGEMRGCVVDIRPTLPR